MCASQKSELYENLKSEIMLFELFITFFDFRFSLILADEVKKIPEYYVICFKVLHVLQTETIIKKITQPKLPKTKNEITKICNEQQGNYFFCF